MCGNKVAGFGYQEINAFYELKVKDCILKLPPGRRYYFTENWGLFSDLKEIMENDWVPKLQESQSISTDMLPVIWDADFFINKSAVYSSKYSLCEINVSCVSPFPPSAMKFMIEETSNRIRIQRIKKLLHKEEGLFDFISAQTYKNFQLMYDLIWENLGPGFCVYPGN